jgi:hypothetical protein
MNAKPVYVKVVLMILFLLPCFLYGNGVEIVINPVNPYSFGSKDFGGATIINTGGEQNAYLRCVIKSVDGTLLIEAKSIHLLLKEGATLINPIMLSYSYITYFNDNLKVTDQRTRSLPAGNYSYCIEVYQTSNEILVGTECLTISLELLTPPISILPDNNSEFEEVYPYFSWIPPLPTPVNVLYRYTLVKVFEGQTPLDAILRNPPIHQTQTGTNFYQYPINAVQLQKGETYAWQIKALVNNDPSEKNTAVNYKTESEVFEFTIKPEPPKLASANPYANINTFGEKIYYTNDTLKIVYREEYNPGKISYSILSPTQDNPVAVRDNFQEVILGDNLLQIPINAFGIKVGDLYWLELKSKTGQKFKLKFIKLK